MKDLLLCLKKTVKTDTIIELAVPNNNKSKLTERCQVVYLSGMCRRNSSYMKQEGEHDI